MFPGAHDIFKYTSWRQRSPFYSLFLSLSLFFFYLYLILSFRISRSPSNTVGTRVLIMTVWTFVFSRACIGSFINKLFIAAYCAHHPRPSSAYVLKHLWSYVSFVSIESMLQETLSRQCSFYKHILGYLIWLENSSSRTRKCKLSMP